MSNPRKRRAAVAAQIYALETRCLLSGATGAWIGQDGHDLVGPSSTPNGDDVQDIRIALGNLPTNKAITAVDIRGYGGGQWAMNPPAGQSPWAAALVRTQGADTADLFVEPYQVETGRSFSIELDYSDGTLEYVWIAGGTADPNLRMPNAALALRWNGQSSNDLASLGPVVGPDTKVDTQISLANLSTSTDIASVVLTSTDGSTWTFGTNPQAGNSAELIRRPADPTKADFYFQADRNLLGQSLTLVVSYTNGKSDSQSLIAGATDPSLAMPTPAAIPITWGVVSGQWVGQVDDATAGLGAAKLTLSGIPAGRTIASAGLSDSVGGTWSWVAASNTSTYVDPGSGALTVRPSTSGPSKADLLFAPGRDESGSTLTARVVLDDGTTLATTFAGGFTDVTKRAPLPALTSVTASPGDDLNDLANRFGTVKLSAGIYNLTQPLVLNRPVTITADAGVTLVFTQPANAAAWSTAIKIQAGNTTLDHFAVRFSGPVRWRTDVSYGPAVIGTTDNTDPSNNNLLVGIKLTRLDLQGPQANSSWDEAVRLMRLVSGQSGKVVGNTLKGGPVEFFGGPWTITDNTYLGTTPNTYSFNVFAAHATHDMQLSRNKVAQTVDSGKTWRFLVMTYGGSNDTISDNDVQGIGPIDGDGVPNVNANEIILTEAYSLKFEGLPSAVSSDGRIVQISANQGDAPRAGDAVAILSGTGAGQYRRITQILSPTAYLLDTPLPSGAGAISIAMGFVGETFQNNTINARNSTTASDLVLAGNHFGTKVLGNHIIGGANPLRFEATPTEHPIVWGWSHAPFLGATISGNTIEDGWLGSDLSVGSGSSVKSSLGRNYFAGDVTDNTFVWTQSFLTKRVTAGLTAPGLNLILEGGSSAGMALNFAGNRVLLPTGVVPVGSVQIHASTINGVVQNSQLITLPTVPPVAPTGLSLVNDTGRSATDTITSDGRIKIDVLTGSAIGAEYLVAGSATYLPIPAAGLVTPTGLVQGVNTVSVRAYDVTGNRGIASTLSLTYDSVAPGVSAPVLQASSDSGRSSSDNITKNTSLSFLSQATEVATAVLLRDGVAVAQGTTGGLLSDPGPVADGVHLYSVRATDLAGNMATGPATSVTIDTLPPNPPASLSATSDGKISFVSGGADLVYEYRLNNATTYTSLGSSTSITLSGLASGANQVRVRAIDVAGNTSADASVSFQYNTNRTPIGSYLGQDGRDYTGLKNMLGADGFQDMHFSLQNLPLGRTITGLQVRGVVGGVWQYKASPGVWGVALFQVSGTGSADVYIQPYQLSTNRTYSFVITFDNGVRSTVVVSGVSANPLLRMQTTIGGQPRPAGDLAPIGETTETGPTNSPATATTPSDVIGHTWQRPNLIAASQAGRRKSVAKPVAKHVTRRQK